MRKPGLKEDVKVHKPLSDANKPSTKRLTILGLILFLVIYFAYTVGTWNAQVIIVNSPPVAVPGKTQLQSLLTPFYYISVNIPYYAGVEGSCRAPVRVVLLCCVVCDALLQSSPSPRQCCLPSHSQGRYSLRPKRWHLLFQYRPRL